MTNAAIVRLNAVEATDLISTEHLPMLSPVDQETILRSIMNSSRTWAGLVDNKLVAMWGLIPPTLMSDTAYLWLVTTKHLRGHQFLFIRHSQRAVEAMLEDYEEIVGHTLIENRPAQQWLRWLGAKFGDPIHGVVYPFTIRRHHTWHQDSAQSA